MAYEAVREVVASAARTVTGTSAAISAAALGNEAGAKLNLVVNVTAVSGTTPTLDVTVEWSHDGGTTWATADPADSFTQVTTAVAKVKQFTVKTPTYRLRWTIAGTTPSFTFTVQEFVQ